MNWKEIVKQSMVRCYVIHNHNSELPIDMVGTATILESNVVDLLDLLENKNVLNAEGLPYQEYIDSGWFRVVEQKFTKPNGDTHINIKTLVYQKGVAGIRKIVQEGM